MLRCSYLGRRLFLPAVLLLGLLGNLRAAEELLPAFPGAEGFGSFTPGGRGGRVIYVTTLEDYDVSKG